MKPRTLSEWLAYLEQLHPVAIDMGLERSREVLARLRLGPLAPKVVTVTGTNGKGSTCAFLASLLASRGLRVGVYSSPHLLRYNERVRVDGIEATDAQLCAAFEAVEAVRGEISLTYFEMGTLAAFWLFARAGLDAVVLEVGLGGRLDTVNLIDADLALITSIGVDHADWLGDTRESVAFEKAGILRPGRPAVCGDPEPPAPLLEAAQGHGSPLLIRGQAFDLSVRVNHWDWHGVSSDGQVLTLEGLKLLDLPMENAALALQAFALLGLPWQPASIADALQRTRLTGRLDRRRLQWRGKPLWMLLDVAHNPHAAEYLRGRLPAMAQPNVRRAVFGLLADKDLAGVIEPLLASVAGWAVATLPSPRSRSAAQLQAALANLGATATSHGSVEAALEHQCELASAEDELLVFGSFFCVADALLWLERHGLEVAADGSAG
ncbi:bifunctional tetrahydrofolate synthase/dihydrofolate synthase [Pseudomonas sp. RIT-PI-S]|uniref:bifunctional tetrahydrofolate synthase/dihydrofolate synthase n=1 Tax=Pseudomonas sp. RIT-PI-S TaxID=3035295 RepID=UPI0021D80938|nr:bifunctional tetrahydrofolate synthase/dihydrofolate synthase [Pseudomonas sp. RIT-PI-S]